MNERILELMAEAGIDVERLRMHPGGWPKEDLLVLEDFAKLIVKECADIANQQFEAATGLSDRDCLTANEMKKRFGVE
jgi:hypothetical protein